MKLSKLIVQITAACCACFGFEDTRAQELSGIHEITWVSNHVFVARPRFGGANATVILGDNAVAIVDPHSSPAAANALLEEIKTRTSTPVNFVINTHWHGDHHGGNLAIRDAYGSDVEFIAHPNTIRDIGALAQPDLRAAAAFYSTFVEKAEAALSSLGSSVDEDQRARLKTYIEEERDFVDSVDSFEYLLPNVEVHDHLNLDLGDLEVRIVHFPRAHTEGDLVVLLPAERILITGDIATAPYVVPRSGFPRGYARAIREMMELEFDRYVLGHGGPIKKDKKFLVKMANFLEVVADFATDYQGPSFDDALIMALDDPSIRSFESRIDWDEPGLRFLDFNGLLHMTLSRAFDEVYESSALNETL